MRKYIYIIVTLILILVSMYILYPLLPLEVRSHLEMRGIQAVIAFATGVLIVEYVAKTLAGYAKKIGAEIFLVRNIILVFGYIVLGVVVLAIIGISGDALLASAAFSGLVIGLGMQPILANFFAGLIILTSGFLKPGKKIKLTTTAMPISTLGFPAYKVFSRDVMIPTIKGTVVEVGFMYTKIMLDTGELIKISNSTLFTSTVVFEEESFESPVVTVRYEFPVEYDPEFVLEKIRESLRGISRDIRVYVEEQSDKNYYIILVVAHTPEGMGIREFRSRILTRLINIQRELRK